MFKFNHLNKLQNNFYVVFVFSYILLWELLFCVVICVYFCLISLRKTTFQLYYLENIKCNSIHWLDTCLSPIWMFTCETFLHTMKYRLLISYKNYCTAQNLRTVLKGESLFSLSHSNFVKNLEKDISAEK